MRRRDRQDNESLASQPWERNLAKVSPPLPLFQRPGATSAATAANSTATTNREKEPEYVGTIRCSGPKKPGAMTGLFNEAVIVALHPGGCEGKMLDSDFWRELAEKFRAVDPTRLLRAHWDYTVKVGEQTPSVVNWTLAGVPEKSSIEFEFEALARRCGPKIYPLMDSLTGWLEGLREYRLNAGIEGTGIMSSPDGTPIAHTYGGIIDSIFEASASLCKIQESLASEKERMLEVEREAQLNAQERRVDGSVLDENQGSPQPLSEPENPARNNHRPAVEAFITKCNKHGLPPVLRRHIWLSAGYKKARQFEYWQASSTRATARSDRNFTRILQMEPEAFRNLLRLKKIID